MEYYDLVKELNTLLENACFLIEEYSKTSGENIEEDDYLSEIHTFATEVLTGQRG